MAGCRECGCKQAYAVETVNRWGRWYERVRCRFCGREWMRGGDHELPAAEEVREGRRKVIYTFETFNPCPICRTPGRVTSTQPPVRYLKCPVCHTNWKVAGKRVEA